MSITLKESTTAKPTHPWLRRVHVAFVPGPTTSLLEEVASGLLHHFHLQGHQVQTTPDDRTDVILTTAPFGKPIRWRQALFFTARSRFNLSHTPTLYTLVQGPPERVQYRLDHFRAALAKEPPDPADYAFPGLAPQAYRVLFEQGRRGGPILALERLVQVQSKSIRVILVVGDDRPLAAYHFDLVGAHPCSEAEDLASFHEDIVLRIVTTVNAREVTEHQVVDEPIPSALWQGLSTPTAMGVAVSPAWMEYFVTS